MANYFVDGMILTDQYDKAIYLGFQRSPDLKFMVKFYKQNDIDDTILVTIHEECADIKCHDSLFCKAFCIYMDDFDEGASGIFLTQDGLKFFKEMYEGEEGE